MDANVGLHDGVAALQWTKDYISHFGGDTNNITAIGESAGGAMIALMLVANEGNGALPFQKVREQPNSSPFTQTDYRRHSYHRPLFCLEETYQRAARRSIITSYKLQIVRPSHVFAMPHRPSYLTLINSSSSTLTVAAAAALLARGLVLAHFQMGNTSVTL
jgi:acetyl esterase/lipase